MPESNGKMLEMVRWNRNSIEKIMEKQDRHHEALLNKFDKLEEIAAANCKDISHCKKELKGIKDEKKEDRDMFLKKTGIIVSIISVIIGVIFHLATMVAP